MIVVVIGAGASGRAGISSTADLTDVARGAMPNVIIPGVGRGYGTEQPYMFPRNVKLSDILDQALRADYGASYDFEVLLDALEELESFVGPRYHPGGNPNVNIPALGAFAELTRRYECINDESLLREARLAVLEAVHRAVASNCESPLNAADALLARERLGRIFTSLADRYRLVVVDFNYDDLLDRIPLHWQDGFVRRDPTNTCNLFSPDDWYTLQRATRRTYSCIFTAASDTDISPSESQRS
jgi:hypothetical protein